VENTKSRVRQESSASLGALCKDRFLLGAAVNSSTVKSGKKLISQHFTSLTAENEMKPSVIHPQEHTWSTEGADAIANYARELGIGMRGHTIVWHQQTPQWLFASPQGAVSREILLDRLGSHMDYLHTRYQDVIYAWDVVNEAISDTSGEYLRPSSYLDIIGSDYIAQAFILARKHLPGTKLYYNDYNVLHQEKQDKIFNLLSSLLEQGVPIDGIGFQGHWNIHFPDGNTLESAIQRFGSLGLDVQITEMDLSFFYHEDKDSRFDQPPKELLELQANRYQEIFQVLLKNSQYISNVTFWGVADDYTWLDYFPVQNRKNWPFLFDQNHEPKESFYRVINLLRK
jgi:endo-1,4-beta-xylanase